MKLKINKLWIEFEFWINSHRENAYSTLNARQWDILCATDTFEWLEVEDEYYTNQLEVKTKQIPYTEAAIADTQQAVIQFAEKLSPVWLVAQNKAPEFVGTHIHMFLTNNSGTPLTDETYPKEWKNLVLANTYMHIASFFMEALSIHSANNAFRLDVLFRELDRITRSNSLGKYYDYNNSWILANILQVHWERHVFSDIGNNKPKYQWLIWSLARPGWKPTSLEIRLIPNMMFIGSNASAIHWLIKDTIGLFNNVLELKRPERLLLDAMAAEVIVPATFNLLMHIKKSIQNSSLSEATMWELDSHFQDVSKLILNAIPAVVGKSDKYPIDIGAIKHKYNL